MDLPTPSLWSAVHPHSIIDTNNHSFWQAFDIESWSEREYRWVQDDWNGMKDTVQAPSQTVIDGTGDCDDYAAVAATYLWHNTDRTIVFAYMYDIGIPVTGHMVTYDGERVFSSGVIRHTDPRAYADAHGYDICMTRTAR
jgi:hypothetical protein